MHKLYDFFSNTKKSNHLHTLISIFVVAKLFYLTGYGDGSFLRKVYKQLLFFETHREQEEGQHYFFDPKMTDARLKLEAPKIAVVGK